MSIKEGIKTELHTMTFTGEDMTLDYDELTNRIIKYLKSQGVVQKVEGELPDERDFNRWPLIVREDMLKAGYTLTKEID